MTTIQIQLPGESAPLAFEVDDNHYIEGDDSSFVKANAVLNFEQASLLAESYAASAQAAGLGPNNMTTSGDPEGDDDLEIIFAALSSATGSIQFDRWSATTATPDWQGLNEFGYGLLDFPFHIDWTVAEQSVEEFVEENIPSALLDVTAKLYAELLKSGGDEDWREGYAEALHDVVAAHAYDVEIPEGFRGYIAAKFSETVSA